MQFARFKKPFSLVGTFQIGAALAQPFFLGKMVGYFNAEIAQREAYLLAMGFVILSFLRSLIYHMGFFVGRRSVGMQLRTGLTALVHKKVRIVTAKESHFLLCVYRISLNLSRTSLQENSTANTEFNLKSGCNFLWRFCRIECYGYD